LPKGCWVQHHLNKPANEGDVATRAREVPALAKSGQLVKDHIGNCNGAKGCGNGQKSSGEKREKKEERKKKRRKEEKKKKRKK